MIEVTDLVKKIYEHTNEKLNIDDPIIAELIAQQLIVEDFSLDIQDTISSINEKIENLYKNQQTKTDILTQELGQKILDRLNEKLNHLQITKSKNNDTKYNEINTRVKNITFLLYALIFANLLTITAAVVIAAKL